MARWKDKQKKRERQIEKDAREREYRRREREHELERAHREPIEMVRPDPYVTWSGNENFWEELPTIVARAKAAQAIVARRWPESESAAYHAALATMDEDMSSVIEPPVDGGPYDDDLSPEEEEAAEAAEQKLKAEVEAVVAAHLEELERLAATMELSEDELGSWLAPLVRLPTAR